jgi:hypothetical protein
MAEREVVKNSRLISGVGQHLDHMGADIPCTPDDQN